MQLVGAAAFASLAEVGIAAAGAIPDFAALRIFTEIRHATGAVLAGIVAFPTIAAAFEAIISSAGAFGIQRRRSGAVGIEGDAFL